MLPVLPVEARRGCRRSKSKTSRQCGRRPQNVQKCIIGVNALMKKAANLSTTGILKYNDEPFASGRVLNDAASCIFDSTQTKVKQGHLVKVVAWFDNEWGFSNRMLDTAEAMMSC